MSLEDKIILYLQMLGLYHLARLNDHWFRLDEPLDMTYQLGLPIDEEYVSGCLTDFEWYIEAIRPTWTWFEELLGIIPPADCIDKFTMKCTWMQYTLSELPQGVGEDIVRRYGRAYIMMLLSTQFFGDKSVLYRCMCHVANRNVVKLAGLL
ncbi:hypothetical protein Ahy_B09g096198 isoform A [Arachis hypogaea]|uniref:Aminotransferase-like plant mobile domain-containing protein n=1 Tax=Arachis hypogaea TaxID=3818 RepID=A0A444XJ42_ARAHY|nr:hypothetical protein Ahy_B09g096198 isoform A [Arachis hypogaea]